MSLFRPCQPRPLQATSLFHPGIIFVWLFHAIVPYLVKVFIESTSTLLNRPQLTYFKDQYVLLLQYEILEKLVTYIDGSQAITVSTVNLVIPKKSTRFN